MNADGGDPKQLTDNAALDYDPSWSPDGSKLAYCRERARNFKIYVMNRDGSDPQRITNQVGTDWEPAWQPVPSAQTP